MSPIEAASVAIDIHNTASVWNKALLDNSARPSGALVYAASNGQMTDEQFGRLKSELETSFQGAAHGCIVCRFRDVAASIAGGRARLEAAQHLSPSRRAA